MAHIPSLRSFGQAPNTALNGSTLQTLCFFSPWDLQLSFMQTTTAEEQASRTCAFARGGLAGTTLSRFQGLDFVG